VKLCYQNIATVHMQAWYIQSFWNDLTWPNEEKRMAQNTTSTYNLFNVEQSFSRTISTSIYLKVTRISLYLETTNQFQMFQHIITNAWGIPLRALPTEYWKAVFAWWHSISKHKQAKKIFSEFLCKATPANDMQLFTKNNSNIFAFD